MGSHHLSHDEFFTKLGELFALRKDLDYHGTIYLTQTRLTYARDLPLSTTQNPFPDLHPAQPMPIIIRATDGKSGKNKAQKIKLSTIVQPSDMHDFYSRYADSCKVGMTALKPRDRSKKKAKARKKRAAAS
ncbi:hypothetical protein CDD81_4962 [Ophiocordyceps australis]|uniref:Signal recognition particle subunit SRP14 n=1 Tax=Ophiocordyceps australis TaxID=1399860 RepID=A0A2C5X6X1_9HYPO|nr:hypothetical protein CDD81_4962 [Ophiocordyceps australis]